MIKQRYFSFLPAIPFVVFFILFKESLVCLNENNCMHPVFVAILNLKGTSNRN